MASMNYFLNKHTCKLVSGSIFCIGPVVLSTNDVLALWFGGRGLCICKGLAGIKPKLERKKKIC